VWVQLTGIRSLFLPGSWSEPVLISPRTPRNHKSIWWFCRRTCAPGLPETRWMSRRNCPCPRSSPPRRHCCCSLRTACTTTCSPAPGPCCCCSACCPVAPHPRRVHHHPKSADCFPDDDDCDCEGCVWPTAAAASRRPSFSSTRPTPRTAPAALRTWVRPFCSSYPA